MSDQQKQIQQLTNDSIILKARIFDFQEMLTQKDNELKQHGELLREIVQILGLHGDEKGVTAESIVEAVRALAEPVPVTGDEEAEV